MSNRVYFKVTKGSKSEEVCRAFKKEYSSVYGSWSAFARKYGCNELFAGDSLLGIVFDGDVPEGWASPKSLPRQAFRPQRKKVCMSEYREFSALKRKPNGIRLAELLGIDCVFSGSGFHMPTYEIIGGELLLLSLHEDSEVPEDVEEIKMSEYWELKEAAQDE